MPGKNQDDSSFGVAVFALLVACFAVGVSFCAISSQAAPTKPCECKPAPTTVACCKADECKQELAQVDARFGDVWDELVEVQEQLAQVKACDCGPVNECSCDLSKACQCEPSKPCACSDKPACECKPAAKPAANSQVPVRRVFKRCK